MSPKSKKPRGSFDDWGETIGWSRRVRAVCKPCWEIKYCPYGPLVEQFPLPKQNDDRSCRIFGHHCPVFYVAEPFTETKELRNISRHIPRPLQFRVLKRENQICRACGKPVQDEDIHFDHIIPWSKGGPTEDHNIRLLCGDCNRRKGANFERDHLVAGLQELVSKPVDFEFVRMLRWLVSTGHAWRQEKKRMPTPKDIATVIGSRKVTEYEEALSQIFQDLDHFFSGGPPEELETELFEALRHRWGFEGGKIHKLSTVAKDRGLRPTDLLAAEISLVSRLGWRVVLSPSQQKKWLAV